jgi:hypothetical protein
MIQIACSRALSPKKNSGVLSVNLKLQPGNRLCNLDLLVFSYAVNSERCDPHSQNNGIQALVIHRGLGIRSFWCTQEYRLSSKHNRNGARRPGNLRMVGMRAFSVVRPPTDCPGPHQNLGHGSVRRDRGIDLRSSSLTSHWHGPGHGL